MIWHIFKKDVRLLWPYALILALVYAARVWVSVTLGLPREPESLRVFDDVLPILVIAGMVVLTVAVVHQDGLFSSTLDWLVRPIPRRDLMWAKVLFILLAIQVPVFLIDMTAGIVDGLSLAGTFTNALGDGFYKFCLVSLPAVMLASMTDRPLSVFAASIFVSFGLLVPYFAERNFGDVDSALAFSGVGWVINMLWALTAIIAAPIILPLQYFKRATRVSYLIFIVVMELVGATWYLPWDAGFAIQQLFAAQPGLASPITVEFAPDTAKRERFPNSWAEPGQTKVTILVPLRFTGVAADSFLYTDHSSVRLVDGAGQVVASSSVQQGTDRPAAVSTIQVYPPQTRADANGVVISSEFMTIPATFYAQYKQQTLRLEVDLSMTLMNKRSTVTLPLLASGIHRENGLACATRLYESQGQVRLSCLTASKPPSCTFAMPLPLTIRQPIWLVPKCMPNYAPLGFTLNRYLIGRIEQSTPIFTRKDDNQLYTPDGTLPTDSQIALQSFEAQDHFTRQLVIPELRLEEWGPESR